MKWADRMKGKLDVMMITSHAISYSDVIQLLITRLHSIADLTSQGKQGVKREEEEDGAVRYIVG